MYSDFTLFVITVYNSCLCNASAIVIEKVTETIVYGCKYICLNIKLNTLVDNRKNRFAIGIDNSHLVIFGYYRPTFTKLTRRRIDIVSNFVPIGIYIAITMPFTATSYSI